MRRACLSIVVALSIGAAPRQSQAFDLLLPARLGCQVALKAASLGRLGPPLRLIGAATPGLYWAHGLKTSHGYGRVRGGIAHITIRPQFIKVVIDGQPGHEDEIQALREELWRHYGFALETQPVDFDRLDFVRSQSVVLELHRGAIEHKQAWTYAMRDFFEVLTSKASN